MASVVFIAITSVLFTIASKVGIFGVPLMLIMLTWFFKYGLVMVEHVAWDQREAPVLDTDMLHPLNQGKATILLIVTGIFFAIFYAAQYWVGPVAGAIIGLAAVGLLPAVIAVQTAQDSALKGLVPTEWFRLIRWMKSDYALVLGGILAFWVIAFLLLFTELGEPVPRLVCVAILMYGWLSVLALLGGAIRERRISDPDDSPLERRELPISREEIEKERDRKIDSIYGEWRSGAQKNAWETLMREVESSADPLDELRWMYERISRWPEPRLVSRVAQEFVPRLLAANRYGEAITVTRQRLAADPEYRPVTANETLRIARVARDGGDRPTARALLRDFPRFFPKDPLQSVADELSQQLER